VGIFLVDDHEVVRQGVRSVIEAADGMHVVGEAGNVEQAMQRISAVSPDVAVLDVRLPDGSGVELCRDIRATHPNIACLMLTSYSDDEALFEAIMAGASGYVLKQVRGSELLDAIQRVARGEQLLDPALTGRVLERLRNPVVPDARLESLTEQERKVLALIAEGRTNRQIGDTLHLAEKTVKNYVSNLLSKLGMDRRTEAAVFAARIDFDRAQRR
jgi:two-component system, NarL family, response regulator DevR